MASPWPKHVWLQEGVDGLENVGTGVALERFREKEDRDTKTFGLKANVFNFGYVAYFGLEPL